MKADRLGSSSDTDATNHWVPRRAAWRVLVLAAIALGVLVFVLHGRARADALGPAPAALNPPAAQSSTTPPLPAPAGPNAATTATSTPTLVTTPPPTYRIDPVALRSSVPAANTFTPTVAVRSPTDLATQVGAAATPPKVPDVPTNTFNAPALLASLVAPTTTVATPVPSPTTPGMQPATAPTTRRPSDDARTSPAASQPTAGTAPPTGRTAVQVRVAAQRADTTDTHGAMTEPNRAPRPADPPQPAVPSLLTEPASMASPDSSHGTGAPTNAAVLASTTRPPAGWITWLRPQACIPSTHDYRPPAVPG